MLTTKKSPAPVFARLLVALLVVVSSGGTAAAQDVKPAEEAGQGYKIPPFLRKTASAVISLFNAPLHPVVRGVASGGGLGTGLAYDFSPAEKWEAMARGVITAQTYWSVQADAGYFGDDSEIQVYARVRDMTQLNYYGPGSESVERNRTNFRLRDQVVGVRGSAELLPWLSIGARAENLLPDVSAGRSTLLPSVGERFSDSSAPGLLDQPRFMRYEGALDVRVPAGAGEAFFQGARYRATYALFSDQGDGRYDFRRLDLEAQQRFALFGPHRRLTLHGWLSTTDVDAGDDVPFYLQRTLGGRSNLRTMEEDLVGSDGTQATLRGFRSYRFRDRHLLLLQAEYRIPVWGPIDATVFADAGKVTTSMSEMDLSNLRHDYGFSLSLMQGHSALVRMDVGMGGGEGTRLIFSFGRDILP